MIINRCHSPVRDFLASFKLPPQGMSTATRHSSVRARMSSALATRPGGSRLEGDLPKAVLKYLPDLMRMATLLNVIFFVNAAPPNGGHRARRADMFRWLMAAPGGNE